VNSAVSQFFSILTLIIGVAIIAVLVSKNAQTSQVIQSFASGMSNILKVVVSPVSGS
jgi:hypothetical protein